VTGFDLTALTFPSAGATSPSCRAGNGRVRWRAVPSFSQAREIGRWNARVPELDGRDHVLQIAPQQPRLTMPPPLFRLPTEADRAAMIDELTR
jgi:hypothetical protein